MKNAADLMIMVDENIEQLDAVLYRAIFCFVEIPKNAEADNVIKELLSFSRKWENDHPKQKFHVTDIDDSGTINFIIDIVKKIKPTVKLYTYYTIAMPNKSELLKGIIKSSMLNHYRDENIHWIIENAIEYGEVFKKSVLTTDKGISIMADLFCWFFQKNINLNDSEHKECIQKIYSDIRPFIHLQFFIQKQGRLPLSGDQVL